MRQKDSIIYNLVNNNSWNLLITIIAVVISFTVLKVKVDANTERIGEVDAKIEEYPSVEYFEEKFTNQEKTLSDFKGDIVVRLDRMDNAIRINYEKQDK